MKKGLLAFIIIVLFMFIPVVYAEQYEVLFKMENELKDNTFTIQLGLREASTMAVMSNIVYNQEKLEFISIDANEYFTVTKGNDLTNGAFKSFKILADSDYAFQKVYFANLTFRIKDSFKKGERTEIYFNNNQAATADEIIKTSPSMVYTLFYDKEGTVSYVVSERNFMTSLNIYLTNNWKKVLIGVFILFGVFIFIRYWIIIKDINIFRKKHEHNHLVEKMKFAKVPVNLQTVPIDEKPEKVRIAKVGKWFKKKQKETEPVEPIGKKEDQIAKLMAEEGTVEEEKVEIPEKGLFVGNQNMGNDNELPDDFSSFGESSSNYAYDDDKTEDESEFDDDDAANLDDLSNMSLTDEDDNQGNKIGIIVLGLLLLTSLFNIKPVNALTDDEMNNLRNMVLGNMTWSSEYDINNDNAVDMLDIIATKDIENITIIQDSITVEDSKPANNFVLKSTSKYIRTTKEGQTKVRTTADGKWKTTGNSNNNSSGNANNNQGNENPEVGSNDIQTKPEPIVKEPTQADASNGEEKKYPIKIEYLNGTGDYNEIKFKFNGSFTFDVYPPSDGYQNVVVYLSTGSYTVSGDYPVYHVTFSGIQNSGWSTISFSKTPTVNSRLNIGNETYDFSNNTPDSTISKKVTIDEHYDPNGFTCNGGFKEYSIEGNIFKGKVADRSGTCYLRLKPKHYDNIATYGGHKITNIYGDYGSTMKNVSMFSSEIQSKNMNLYCGSEKFTPKSVEWTKQSLGNMNAEGYRYIFDVRITGNDCELR